MTGWGPFYAKWGIVTIITWTGAADTPNVRGDKLVAAIEELKKLNADSSSPIFGKLSGSYGTSGYSMGGGGTTWASQTDPTFKTSVGLAPWGPVTGMTVPTLFLEGNADTVAGMAVPSVASGTPSMQVVFTGYTHFNWFGPTDPSGYYALAWQKVYLDGDERWKPLLDETVTGVASKNP
jgi:hypothetical protein